MKEGKFFGTAKALSAVIGLGICITAGVLGCDSPDNSSKHVHIYSMERDSNYHWMECSCGEQKDKEAHKFSEWETLEKPTSFKNEVRRRACSVCHYSEKKEIEGTKTESIKEGFVKLPSTSGLNIFVCKTELTYSSWHEVYTWALSNGYTFANAGKEGSSGTAGAAPTKGSRQPVTNVSWRDAVVWCNAASEKDGLTPVYYYRGEVLKTAESNSVNEGESKAENADVKQGNNGYRLPRETEWRLAASGGENYKYAGSDNIEETAWYVSNSSGKTHDVGLKNANAYGLYDMSGNVWEFTQDRYSYDSENDYYLWRKSCGGSYGFYNCDVHESKSTERVTWASDSVGIRIVCTDN